MKLSEKMSGVSTNVNVLRFIAAICVVFCHSFYVAANRDDPFSLFCKGQTNLGGLAVAIFFFLSGFYVTKSLYRKGDVKEYFKKRFIRIFPQLWVVVLLSVCVLGPILTENTLGEYFGSKQTYTYLLNGFLVPIHNLPGVFADNIYGATVNGSLWTLPIEFAAYCGLALVLIFSRYVLKNEKHQKNLHIAGVMAMLLLFVFADEILQNDFLVTVLRPIIVFFAGVLYCDYADKIKLSLPLAAGMLLLLLLSCKLGFLNYAIIFCLPYITVTFALGTKQIKFSPKIFAVSYELYLFAWPVQQIVTHLFGGRMSPYINWLITVPIATLLAFALFIAVERSEERKNGTK